VTDYETTVLEHYRSQAEQLGLSELSTMPDAIVREREVDAICRYLERFREAAPPIGRLLEVGCGNGFLLSVLRERYPDLELVGIDYSEEMVALAQSRRLDRCDVARGDVRELEFESGAFDVVVSERCVINLLVREDQSAALAEVHRVLRRGGLCVLQEGFSEGLDNLNRARAEFDLDPIPMPFHNLFLHREWFDAVITGLFAVRGPRDFGDETLPDFNFLSSHYFMSRVVHAALTRKDVRNSEFVRFFSFLPPIGNYASVQLLVLERL
jgi:SAM-dependent methyltransferase